MPLIIERNDITKMQVDAIVNAANNSLLGGGGVDGAIHRAAGEKLLQKCKTLGGCETGGAKITKGYDLPAKYIIHTVGPQWKGGSCNEEELLASCYRNSLLLAKRHGCKSVAFPLISSGAYRFPKKKALDIATSEVRKFLNTKDITVYIVVYDKESFGLGKELYPEIKQFIDDKCCLPDRRTFDTFGIDDPAPVQSLTEFQSVSPCYSSQPIVSAQRATEEKSSAKKSPRKSKSDSDFDCLPSMCPAPVCSYADDVQPKKNAFNGMKVKSLEEKLSMLDESFSELLLRKIDESGMKDSECYKKANIDRKLFSKIRSDKNYRPSKPTVLAFAIALGMNITDTKEFLARAGFALSSASKFDVIVEYFITNGIYDIFEINNALFSFDQNLLGA